MRSVFLQRSRFFFQDGKGFLSFLLVFLPKNTEPKCVFFGTVRSRESFPKIECSTFSTLVVVERKSSAEKKTNRSTLRVRLSTLFTVTCSLYIPMTVAPLCIGLGFH